MQPCISYTGIGHSKGLPAGCFAVLNFFLYVGKRRDFCKIKLRMGYMDAFFHEVYSFFYTLWNQITAVVLSATIVDVLDIAVIAFIIYEGIQLIKETRAQQLLKGIILLLIIYIVSGWLGMVSLSWLMNKVFNYAIIAIAIIFQPEIRRALEHMGRSNFFRRDKNSLMHETMEYCIDEVCKSAQDMQDKKIGALIVFERQTPLGEIADTGTVIDAEPSEALISNVFYPKSPLHDGGMVIKNGRVFAAGCIFPLTATDIGQEMGTRHRAAVGLSENSDGVVVVVSEETGTISIALSGKIMRGYNGLTLRQKLNELLITEEEEAQGKGPRSWFKNIGGGKKNEQK